MNLPAVLPTKPRKSSQRSLFPFTNKVRCRLDYERRNKKRLNVDLSMTIKDVLQLKQREQLGKI